MKEFDVITIGSASRDVFLNTSDFRNRLYSVGERNGHIYKFNYFLKQCRNPRQQAI